MSTKRQNNKRKTKQIRISVKIHKKIKFMAIEKNTTISKLSDKIIENYIKNRNNQICAKSMPNVYQKNEEISKR